MHQSVAGRRVWTSVRPRARLGIGALLAALLAVVFVGVVPSLTAGARSAEADDYVARINALRSSVGVQSLAVDGQLDGVAQSCADRLAGSQALVHTSNLAAGITSNWTKLGENIGMGPQNDTIWSAFLHSAQHYANLVDPAFNRVGIGVAYGGGSQWTCHRFMAVSGGGDQPAAARTPAAARSAAPKAPRVSSAPPAPDPAPVVTLPPRPMPGPPPPADSARVAAVLQAMHALSTDAPPHPSTDSARVTTVLQAVHALSAP